jgi:hypothetical protein
VKRHESARRTLGLISTIGADELVDDPELGYGLVCFTLAYASPTPPLCTCCKRPFLVGSSPATWLRMVFEGGATLGLGALCGSCAEMDHATLGRRLMIALRQTRIVIDAELVSEANLHFENWGRA